MTHGTQVLCPFFPRKKIGRFFFTLFFLWAIGMILVYPDVAGDSVRSGLLLCGNTVIPSLFPFMVLSELLISGGSGELPSRFFGKKCRTLFGIPEESAPALILGLVCGFPVGTCVALRLYDAGRIAKDDLARIVCFCNIPGSAFLVGAVGSSLFGNRRFGMLLVFAVILSSLLVGFLLPGKKKGQTEPARSVRQSSRTIPDLSTAITSASGAMITVCACILFFSALIALLAETLKAVPLPEVFRALLFGALEMVSGTRCAAALGNIRARTILCAFLVGFGGFSVHFQFRTLCAGYDIPFGRYLMCRLAIGGLSAIIVGLLCPFLCGDFPRPALAASLPLIPTGGVTVFSLLAFLVGVLLPQNKTRA